MALPRSAFCHEETACDLAALQREDLRELGFSMVEAAKVLTWAQARVRECGRHRFNSWIEKGMKDDDTVDMCRAGRKGSRRGASP